MYNNYQFWNYRALRQYLHYLLKGSCYTSLIVPLIATIHKQPKKHAILSELSDTIIEQAIAQSEEIQHQKFTEISDSISHLLGSAKNELM